MSLGQIIGLIVFILLAWFTGRSFLEKFLDKNFGEHESVAKQIAGIIIGTIILVLFYYVGRLGCWGGEDYSLRP